MREAVVAQGRPERLPAERSRARRPEEEARLARAAFDLCAQGDFGRALAIALPLSRVSAAAAVTAGSALRQSHRHADAEAVERRALRIASADQRVHLLIGLAADAVGLGNASACARRLVAAAAALPTRDPRARIRLAWVRTEHALLIDAARDAARHAREALRRSRSAGFARHEAKSLLFVGVCLRRLGAARWRSIVEQAAEIAAASGARPVQDVARDVLAMPD